MSKKLSTTKRGNSKTKQASPERLNPTELESVIDTILRCGEDPDQVEAMIILGRENEKLADQKEWADLCDIGVQLQARCLHYTDADIKLMNELGDSLRLKLSQKGASA